MAGGGEVAADVVAAVSNPGGHVDTVGEDEPNAAQEPSEEEGRGEKDEGEDQHGPVVPVQGGREREINTELILILIQNRFNTPCNHTVH